MNNEQRRAERDRQDAEWMAEYHAAIKKGREKYELEEQAQFLAAHIEKPDGYIKMKRIKTDEKPDGCTKILWAIPLLIILANVLHTLIRMG